MKTLVGTPYYVAPEVLDGDYGKECDCWSLGVIMYAVLSGCLPFFGQTPKEVFDKIIAAKIQFNTKEFRGISESAKDLISKLLTKDKQQRYTCSQALKHPWFVEADTQKSFTRVIDPKILEKLVSYKGISALRKEAMNVLVKMLDVKHVTELRLAFHTIDKDQTGMITVEELQEALASQD